MVSRFVKLEDLDEPGCSDKATGDKLKGVTDGGVKVDRSGSGETGRKSKQHVDAMNVDGLTEGSIDGFVLRGSRLSLVEDLKRADTAGEGVSVNPSGQSIIKRTKDRILKEVTNKLDVGAVAFKPLRARPRVGSGNASREIHGLNNINTAAMACLGSEGAVRMSSSVSWVGQPIGRPPYLKQLSKIGGTLNVPQINERNEEKREEEAQGAEACRICNMDNVITETNQGDRPVGKTGI